MTEVETVSEAPAPLTLSPFEFHGNPTSVIAGLGGDAPLPEPTYAFHTNYVPVARGHAQFIVKFDRLQARRGTLWLRIHMLPVSGAARMVTSQRVQLNWLAHHGGEVQLRFEAFRGATYAIMGMVPDESDASAEGLTITLDRPATAADLLGAADVAEAQSTEYVSETIKGASLLISTDLPNFTAPVCQPCTSEQLREKPFRALAKRVARSSDQLPEVWEAAYTVQVLERYGLLQAGARGLALGSAGAKLKPLLVEHGTSCDVVTLGNRDDDAGGAHNIDPEGLPGELFAYDYLLSIRATGSLSNMRSAQAYIVASMECLRPGGLAVHVVGCHLSSRHSSRTSFDRNNLEQTVLALISRGHQVARLKPLFADTKFEATGDGLVPFGIIARRAGSIL